MHLPNHMLYGALSTQCHTQSCAGRRGHSSPLHMGQQAAHDLVPHSTAIPGPRMPMTFLLTPNPRLVRLVCAALGNINHWFFTAVPLTSTMPLLPHCPLLSLPLPPTLETQGLREFSRGPFSLSSSIHPLLITLSTAQGCKYYPTVMDAQVNSPNYTNCLLDTFLWSGLGPPKPTIFTPDSPHTHTHTAPPLPDSGER